MKTNHIKNFNVKDYPDLLKPIDPLNEEDLSLMKNIWMSNIQRCIEEKLPVEKDWLDDEKGLHYFCSFYAQHRNSLRELHNLKRGDRGRSIEMLQWRYTKGPKAGFYAENLSYMVPMNTIDPKTGLYDYKEGENDRVKLLDLKGFEKSSNKKGKKGKKRRKIKKLGRKISFTYEMWEKVKSKTVIPTIHNVPNSIACVISERSGRKVKVTKAIADKGGHPYNGLLWLRKNPGKTIDDAVEHTVKELAEIVKKKGNNYEDSVKDLAKSCDKVPESTIRQVMMDLFAKEGEDFSMEKVEKKVKRKNAHAVPCFIWNEKTQFVEYASTDLAADALGYTERTVRQLIYTGKKTGNKYWITRGEIPAALEPEFEYRTDMEQFAQAMHILLKDTMSPTEERFINLRIVEKDLSLIAKKLNLKEEILSVMWDELMDRLQTKFTLLKALEENTSQKLDSLSADSKKRASKLAKGESLSKDGDGFIAYPDEGISEFTAGTSSASNVNKSGSKKGKGEDVDEKK